MTRGLLLVLGCLAAALLPATAVEPPRLDGWRIIGPGGGGATMLPTISPHDPRVVLVACDMTGAYITEDGGDSWRMFNLGDVVASFAFDPADPNVIYAGTAALWRSADRGRTWRMIFPDPARHTRALFVGDHADYVLRSDDPLWAGADERTTVQGIAVTSDGVVTIALGGGGPRGAPRSGTLLQSADKGEHWRTLRDLPPGRVLALSAAKADDLVVVLDRRVVRHAAGADAKDWIEHDGPPGSPLHDASATISTTGGRAQATIYALNTSTWSGGRVANGLFVSRDDGATWTAAAAGLDAAVTDPGSGDPPAFRAVTVSPSDPAVAYVGIEGLQLGAGADQRFNGIAKTTDGGRVWRIVHRESNRPSPQMVVGSWLDERAVTPGPDVWFDAPYDIAVSPTRPDIVFVTDLFRTYRTLDGGAHFAQVHSRAMGSHRWTTRGLDVTTAYGVHADPFDARRLFISYTDIGLFRSEDGGRSWMISSEGIPQRWRNTVYWMVFDPAVRGLAWAALSGTHDLPRPKMWRTRDPSTYLGGVGLSRDGGRSWTPAAGLPAGAVTHLLLDPRSPAGTRTLYACLFGRGVYKTTDGGGTWTLKNGGLPEQPFAWRLTQAPSGRLYLVVARRSENGRLGDAGDGAVYASGDGAEHWTRLTLPAGTNGPNAITVDSKDERRLYLAAWGVAHPDGDTGGGIFVSTDGGATWRATLDSAQHVYDVTQDPRTGTLYASGFDQGAWASDDRGEHWRRLRGYDFKWGHRVVPDPASSGRVYITTFGGSVWHGPAR